jgi:hypothetical protein
LAYKFLCYSLQSRQYVDTRRRRKRKIFAKYAWPNKHTKSVPQGEWQFAELATAVIVGKDEGECCAGEQEERKRPSHEKS